MSRKYDSSAYVRSWIYCIVIFSAVGAAQGCNQNSVQESQTASISPSLAKVSLPSTPRSAASPNSPTRWVSDLAFTTDSKTLITAEKKLKFWDVRSGRLMRTLPYSAGAIACSPNGQILALRGFPLGASWKPQLPIMLVDLRTGKVLRSLPASSVKESLLFSPSGEIIARLKSSTAQLYEVRSGRLLKQLKVHRFSGGWKIKLLGFTNDGRNLLAYKRPFELEETAKDLLRSMPNIKAPSAYIQTWDVRSGKLKRQRSMPMGFEDYRHDISVSQAIQNVAPNGAGLASSIDKKIAVWSGRTGKLMWQKSVPRLSTLTFSADGRLLAGASFAIVEMPKGKISATREVWIWNAQTGKLLRRLTGNFLDTQTLRFSPDNRFLTSVGRSFSHATTKNTYIADVQIWNVRTGKKLHQL